MATICGWVVIFRVLLAFFQRWFLWMLPEDISILISGLLELTNGCCRLSLAVTPGARFVLASLLLGFGGLCVGLQTISVTQGLGTGLYFPGKLVQTGISFALAFAAQYLLFPRQERLSGSPAMLALLSLPFLLAGILKLQKNRSSNLARQGV